MNNKLSIKMSTNGNVSVNHEKSDLSKNGVFLTKCNLHYNFCPYREMSSKDCKDFCPFAR